MNKKTLSLSIIGLGLIIAILVNTYSITRASTAPLRPNGPANNGLTSVLMSPPQANDDSDTLNEDTSVTTNVLSNDTGLELTPLTLEIVVPPVNGDVSITSENSITYTPDDDFYGDDEYRYKVCDNATNCSEAATVYLTVNPVNDPPSFTKGPNQTVNEDSGARTVANWAINISPGPANEASQTVTFNVSNNNTALFSAQPAISSAGTLTFTPAADAFGSATITVTLQDSGGIERGGVDTSPAQTFTITVDPVNDPPSFTKGPNQTVNEDSGARTVANWATNISPGPANEVGQTVTFNVSNNNTALFSAQPAISSAGALTFTPAPDAFGSATVTVTAQDNGGTENGGVDTSAPQTFTITVDPVNDPPVVSNFSKSGPEDTPLTFTTGDFSSHFSDVDGDSLVTVRIDSLPDNGALQLSENTVIADQEIPAANLGNLAFVPNPNWHGSTSFSWNGSDGQLYALNNATVTITITRVNDPPVVSNFAKSGPEDTNLAFTAADFTANFFDVDDDPLVKVRIVSLPDNGALKLSENTVIVNQEILAANLGNLAFVPNPNWNGGTSFTWNGSDGQLYALNNATVTINITPVNDPPVVSNFAKTGLEDASLIFTTGDFSSHFSDVEGDSLVTVRIVSLPANGTLKLSDVQVIADQEIPAANLGNLAFVPNQDWNGITSFTWNGSDEQLYALNNATVTITITPVNDPPSFTKGPNQAVDQDIGPHTVNNWATNISPGPANEASQSVTFNVTNNNNALFSAQPAISSTGALSFTPDPDTFGIATVTVKLKDNGGTANGGVDTSAPQTFTITVNHVNKPPLALNDFYDVIYPNTLIVAAPGVLANDSDVDGDALTALLVSGPANADEFNLNANGSFLYKPKSGFIGEDRFTYQASDGKLKSQIATVDINVADTTHPQVSWKLPVKNGEIYEVNGEIVLLEVEASDDVAVNLVWFFRWDAVAMKLVDIGTVTTPPYQIQLDTSKINLDWNQIFARAYDNVGNESGRPHIWLFRKNTYRSFLPIMTR